MAQANVVPQHEDFEPSLGWLEDAESHTLCVVLPGFTKENLKVQITNTRILKVSGARKMNDKEDKLRRFHKELPIPQNADTSKIRAKFENGVLYVSIPKITTKSTQLEAPKPQQQPPKPYEEPPKEQHDYEKRELKGDKGKVEENDVKKDANKDEATSSKGEVNNKAMMEKRLNTLELVSNQTQEYKSAVYGMVEGLKRQRKFVNLVLAFLFVLVFVLYVNNAIKSYFGGGTKSQEL